MKPSREPTVAVVAAVVTAVAVVAVVVVTAVVVIEITIVTSANHAGSNKPRIGTDNTDQDLSVSVRENPWLFSCFRHNLQRDLFRAAFYDKHILLAPFHLAQRRRVVIHIPNMMVANLDDLIAGFKSGLCRRRILAHTVQQQTIITVRVVGDGSEIDAEDACTWRRMGLSDCVRKSFVG